MSWAKAMSHPGHHKNVCEHGEVVSQCRCPGGVTRVVDCVDPDACREKYGDAKSYASFKNVTTYEELYWENIRQEHRRGRCSECQKGGCISNGE